ncbi:uncharacterized protein LOC132611984 [Lycium barbarum]|uniref:uncharacterized protein LOC132611984 n=1 Tax=Lycium barbarum TaxID=112863 RepID=UPI00293E6F3C|nr:uncharacterized protein LOC132611984 [Lycium barbarum]
METAREGLDNSSAQPHLQERVGERFSNSNFPRTSGSEVENNQGARAGPHPQMSHSTPAVDPRFQQMADFFRHMARRMSDPNEMNFKKMRKMGGVEFEGTVDPTNVEQWLECIERVFEQLECLEAAKFKYVVSLLQKNAYDWWVSVPNAKEKPSVLTWNDFVKEFHMKLSRYASGIINNEKDKCRLFEDGLNDSIRKSVSERIEKEQASRIENKFRKTDADSRGLFKRGRFDNSKAGSVHRRASGTCFECESFDQKVKDCPNPNPTFSPRTEGSFQKPITTLSQRNRGARSRNTQVISVDGDNQASESRATARAYAMRQRDDQDGADVVVGKFHLFGLCVVKLFDPGSTNSYVCSSLVFPKNVKSVGLDCGVLVQSPLGQQVACNQIYRGCPLVIQNLVFPADLIEMPFQDYDVIIDMD